MKTQAPPASQKPPGPGRLVSLTPTTTEILFALGLDKGLVGVTAACDYPPRAARKARVGPVFRPDPALIEELAPDLVVAQGSAFRDLAAGLARPGRRIEVIDPASLDEILDDIEHLGRLTGAEAAAKRLRARIETQLASVAGRLKGLGPAERPLTVRLLEADPIIIAGPGSFMADVIRAAGGRPPDLEDKAAYPSLTPRRLAELDPEVVYLCGWSAEDVAQLNERPGWRETRAIRRGRVAVLPCGLACRPGPRVGRLVELLARALHPDRFPEGEPG